jgi:hypothetical protein
MMPGGFVPVRLVRERKTIVAFTVVSSSGYVLHQFRGWSSLNPADEGVYWLTGHHDPDCDELLPLRAAELLER